MPDGYETLGKRVLYNHLKQAVKEYQRMVEDTQSTSTVSQRFNYMHLRLLLC